MLLGFLDTYLHEDVLVKFVQTLRDCEEVLSQHHEANCKDNIPPATQTCIDKFHNDFEISMLDDLHTPVVLAAMSDTLKTINDLLHTRQVPFSNLYQYFAQNFWVEGCSIFVTIQIE
ncbi:hypothetical protein IFM89_026996 [Coptis chinensis]|uniref:Uncharacterized protein n=1 Tax=Coptis chinensis TaxID=261450 RepID=A0A835I6X2_9MAGN|nr:hypothetical protein IFM89_026996 [Coptis chinensis]